MAIIYEPRIYKPFTGVRSALTLRGDAADPYGLNMSLAVGDDPARVLAARTRVAGRLGFDIDHLAWQRQVHGCVIRDVRDGYQPSESDALACDRRGWLLAISIADCVPVLVYDPVREVVAGAHSGWRGTAQNVTTLLIDHLAGAYGSRPADLHVYVGAAAGQCCYEVGEDVVSQFDMRHSRPLGGGKYLFDNKGAVLAQLLAAGVGSERIEVDARCTICDPALHSYRREGARSGRMFALIGMIDTSAERQV